MTLLYIVLATLAGGLLSVLIAAALNVPVLARLVKSLVSLSTGVLLGTALLQVLPEAFESKAEPHGLFATLLGGLLFFFLLEKAELYRHGHHHEGDDPHHHHHHGFDAEQAGRGGWSVLVGDSIHNFCDGVIIAAAFLTDTQLGLVTALAIVAHEIPQEVGDFIVLVNAGFARRRRCCTTRCRGWPRWPAACSATSSSAPGRRCSRTCWWWRPAASSTWRWPT
jgi:zinc and cadmium transporter